MLTVSVTVTNFQYRNSFRVSHEVLTFDSQPWIKRRSVKEDRLIIITFSTGFWEDTNVTKSYDPFIVAEAARPAKGTWLRACGGSFKKPR
jgi:hypothetical protein